MPPDAIAENEPFISPRSGRRRAPLSLVVCLFVGNGLIWFGVGLLVGGVL